MIVFLLVLALLLYWLGAQLLAAPFQVQPLVVNTIIVGDTMLTFDARRALQGAAENPLKELVKKHTPDEIECGENNDYWIFARRSTLNVELRCKKTGVTLDKGALSDMAKRYGLSPAQVSALKTAFAL